jgi:hypothetical protein
MKDKFEKMIQDHVKKYFESDQFAEDFKERMEVATREEYLEEADWIGKTGL